MVEITKLSIGPIIFWFVLYVVLHIIIGKIKELKERELEEKPGNVELESQVKMFTIAFKFFPIVYLISVVIGFYLI